VKGRLGTVVTVVVLLGVGFLLGSFWLQWRGTRLRQPGSEVEGTPVTVPEGFASRARVEVLNGSGEPGAAGRAASRLRAMGFDVVYFGNASSFGHAHTRVLARSTDRGAARRVADSIGLDSAISRPDTSLYLDATVILGDDWHDLLEVRSRSQKPSERPASLLDRILHAVHR